MAEDRRTIREVVLERVGFVPKGRFQIFLSFCLIYYVILYDDDDDDDDDIYT